MVQTQAFYLYETNNNNNYSFTEIWHNTNLLTDACRFHACQPDVLSSSGIHDNEQHSIHNRIEYLLGLAALLWISVMENMCMSEYP